MAEWTRRTVTTTHTEYALPNPTNWTEVEKVLTAIRHEVVIANKFRADDDVTITATDDEIVFRLTPTEEKHCG